jgi:hypothetical protein
MFTRRLSEEGQRHAEAFSLDRCHARWSAALDDVLSKPITRPSRDGGVPRLHAAAQVGRLERLGMTPGLADGVRRVLGRHPTLPDGWAEWPGTLSSVDHATEIAMLDELRRLDGASVGAPC